MAKTAVDIINALNTIKEVCEENERCEQCPFGDSRGCHIENSDPCDWKIATNKAIVKFLY